MNRDFIGALLQLNAEKGVPREQLVRTVEDAIQSAPTGAWLPATRTSTSRSTRRPARCASSAPGSSSPRSRTRPPSGPSTRPTRTSPTAEPRATSSSTSSSSPRTSAASTPRSPARSSASACARRSARTSSTSSRIARARSSPARVSRVEPRGVILDLGKAEAILPHDRPVGHGALPHRPARQGLRAGGPPDHARSAHLREPHAQELPAPPLRAGGAGDPRRHRGDQGHRPRGRQPQQDGRLQPPGGPRPGGRHRRPARRPRAGRRRRAGRREDRHHPLVGRPGRLRRQRPQPGPGRGRRDRRGATASPR